MLGLLVIIIISWILLRWLVNASPESLGLLPKRQRLIQFLVGLSIAVISSVLYFGAVIFFSKTQVSVNPAFNATSFLRGFWWTAKSVLYEEFLFRGALLYLAIRYMGASRACILSAIAFGAYHWFSYEIFGNIVQMIFLFLSTGIMGALLAYCFVRTRSMYLQIAIHLGWNFVTIVIFSQGPLDKQLLEVSDGHRLTALVSILLFLFQITCAPLLTILYLRSRFVPPLPTEFVATPDKHL